MKYQLLLNIFGYLFLGLGWILVLVLNLVDLTLVLIGISAGFFISSILYSIKLYVSSEETE